MCPGIEVSVSIDDKKLNDRLKCTILNAIKFLSPASSSSFFFCFLSSKSCTEQREEEKRNSAGNLLFQRFLIKCISSTKTDAPIRLFCYRTLNDILIRNNFPPQTISRKFIPSNPEKRARIDCDKTKAAAKLKIEFGWDCGKQLKSNLWISLFITFHFVIEVAHRNQSTPVVVVRDFKWPFRYFTSPRETLSVNYRHRQLQLIIIFRPIISRLQ